MFAMEGTYSTHEGAGEIFTDLAGDMDKYATDYARIADPAWKMEFTAEAGETKRAGSVKA